MPGQPTHPELASNFSTADEPWKTLAEFSLPSTPGSERRAMEQVAGCAHPSGIRPAALERLKTAVAEATLNAIEHGNHYRAELLVQVKVACCSAALRVEIRDQGEGEIHPCDEPPSQPANFPGRGWGMFLIQQMVDEMKITSECTGHSVELIMHLAGRTGESCVPPNK